MKYLVRKSFGQLTWHSGPYKYEAEFNTRPEAEAWIAEKEREKNRILDERARSGEHLTALSAARMGFYVIDEKRSLFDWLH